MVLGKLDIHEKTNETMPHLTPFAQVNSRWIVIQNVKCKTKKLIEDIIREFLYDLAIGKDFLNYTLKKLP